MKQYAGMVLRLTAGVAVFLGITLYPTVAAAQPGSSLDTLHHVLDSLSGAYELAGMTVALVRDDSVTFTKGYGWADIARQIPVTDSTLFRIASISKTATAAAIMQLHEQGFFSLGEDVSRYLGFSLRNPHYPSDSITFRQLLSHTSSLRDGSGYGSFLSATASSNPPPHLQTLLAPGGAYYTSDMWSSTRRPPAHYFTYANINFGVLGTLVEKLSGERFDVYCREHVLQALGMTASFNVQDLPTINNVAVLYRKSGATWVPQADNYGGVRPPPRNLSGYVLGSNGLIFSPQGGLRVSAPGLARFMRALMNDGVLNGARVLNDTTVALMRANEWVYSGTNGDNYYGIFNAYGLGISTTGDLLPGQVLIGHPGEAYGLLSDMYFSSDHSYGIVFITNGGARNPWDPGRYSGWYRVEEDVYQAALRYGVVSSSLFAGEGTGVPPAFQLFQNFPNPFNPSTTVVYQIPTRSRVLLDIFTVLGQHVTTLVDAEQGPGPHRSTWTTNSSSGIYLVRLRATPIDRSHPYHVETRAMVILR